MGTNHATAKIFELDGGQWVYGVDYLIRGGGQFGPLFYSAPAESLEMARLGCYDAAQDICKSAQARGLKGRALQSLWDWANDLRNPARWIAADEGRREAPAALPAPLPLMAEEDYPTAVNAAQEAVLEAGQILGRLEATDFLLTVGTSTLLEIYKKAKENKAWRFVKNPKILTGKNFESLEEFCEVKLGKSYKRLQAILANANLMGGDAAFEQAEKLGLRQKDYAAIKALPAPDQELIRRAVEEADSRDAVLEILQELAAKNQREKEALQKSLAAKETVIADQKAEISAARGKPAELDAAPAEAGDAGDLSALEHEKTLTQKKAAAKAALDDLSRYLSQHAGDLAGSDEEAQRIKEDAFDDFLRYVRKHLRAQSLDALDIMRAVVADDEAASGFLDFARAGMLDALLETKDSVDATHAAE
jgi:hypothetical protein